MITVPPGVRVLVWSAPVDFRAGMDQDVLERIVSGDVKAHQLDRLLPWNWKAERAGRTAANHAA